MINDDLRSGRLTWQDITEERTHGAYPTERELAADLDARNNPIPNHRDSACDTMTVTIMYRNSYHGGDGWTYYPITVAIAGSCPVCGGKRGEPTMRRFCEDGEWYDVSTWRNPCGHRDRYQDVYAESKQENQS